jgi:hypothetical protein
MARVISVDGGQLTMEDDADLGLNRFVKLDSAATGMIAYCGADELMIGVVVAQEGSAAPYIYTVQYLGVAQVESDGAGAIDEGDAIASGANGQCKKRAIADGATTRYWAGVALSPAAATAGLLVDVLLRPQWASNS